MIAIAACFLASGRISDCAAALLHVCNVQACQDFVVPASSWNVAKTAGFTQLTQRQSRLISNYSKAVHVHGQHPRRRAASTTDEAGHQVLPQILLDFLAEPPTRGSDSVHKLCFRVLQSALNGPVHSNSQIMSRALCIQHQPSATDTMGYAADFGDEARMCIYEYPMASVYHLCYKLTQH